MATLTELDAVTERLFLPQLIDNAFNTNVTFVWLYSKKKISFGGSELVQPVLLNIPSGATSYAGADELPLQFNTVNFGAEFPWSNYAMLVPITGEDDYKNSGDQAIINIIKVRLEEADMALRNRIGIDIQLDGTGNFSKNLLGLSAAVDDGTSVGTYGNISRTTFPNWKAQLSANGGVGRALTMDLINHVFQNASKDNDRPDIIISAPDVHVKFTELIQPMQRITGDTTVGNVGFPNVMYFGRPWVVDEQVQAGPNGKIWMLNSNYLELQFQGSRVFFWVPFQQLERQDAAVGKILTTLQMICKAPRMNAQIKDVDPTL